MKSFATLSLALAVNAFAPAPRTASTSELNFFGSPAPAPAPAIDLGVLPPLGLWDPLGLAEDTAAFPRRRAVEIKHGRISMMAFIGMIVQELGITFPGYIDLGKTTAFADIGTGFGGLAQIPLLGVLQIVAFAGLAEDTAAFPRRRAVEIKHGRISMMAFIGMIVQELGITFPGYIDLGKTTAFADIGTGFGGLAQIPLLGVLQIVAFAGIAETVAMPSSQYTGGPQNLPGGFDGSAGTIPGGYPFTTQITDPEERTKKLNIEIQNGRAAMLGVFGCMCHSMLDSTDHHFFYPITHN